MVGAVSRIFKEEFAEARNEERRILTDKLISRGWDPQEAAVFTGLSAAPSPAAGMPGIPR